MAKVAHLAPEQVPMRIKELERSKIAGHLRDFKRAGGKVTVLAHGDCSPPKAKKSGRHKMALSPAFNRLPPSPKMAICDDEE